MSDLTAANEHTRRSFLDVLLGLGVLGTLGSVFYPVVRYLTPLPAAGPTGPATLTRDEVSTLEQKQFVIVPVGGKRVLVVQDAEQNLHALAARCTHEGCTVQYVPGESVIWCACHNARFNLDGRVLAGPPPKPLPKFTARRGEDGSILVLKESA
jgi:cytochrome b6-f complex iron-sulfur subunit